MAFVEAIRSRYSDAGHHCFAYRLGAGDDGFRVSDDGEPGGTAGQPILNHIDGANLRNVVIVVTRYFGGTKLGKGGLIRAYGGTAGEAIAASAIVEVRETQTIVVECSYADQGAIEGIVRAMEAESIQADFGAAVRLSVALPTEVVDAAIDAIVEATSGRAHVTNR